MKERRKANARDILGHGAKEPPLPFFEKKGPATGWHGKRKQRRSTYQIPGQTVAHLGLGLSDQGNLV